MRKRTAINMQIGNWFGNHTGNKVGYHTLVCRLKRVSELIKQPRLTFTYGHLNFVQNCNEVTLKLMAFSVDPFVDIHR